MIFLFRFYYQTGRSTYWKPRFVCSGRSRGSSFASWSKDSNSTCWGQRKRPGALLVWSKLHDWDHWHILRSYHGERCMKGPLAIPKIIFTMTDIVLQVPPPAHDLHCRRSSVQQRFSGTSYSTSQITSEQLRIAGDFWFWNDGKSGSWKSHWTPLVIHLWYVWYVWYILILWFRWLTCILGSWIAFIWSSCQDAIGTKYSLRRWSVFLFSDSSDDWHILTPNTVWCCTFIPSLSDILKDPFHAASVTVLLMRFRFLDRARSNLWQGGNPVHWK